MTYIPKNPECKPNPRQRPWNGKSNAQEVIGYINGVPLTEKMLNTKYGNERD